MRAWTITARQPASLTAAMNSRKNGQSSMIVDADPALDRHGNVHGSLHRANAVCDELRSGHQAGAEGRLLHSVAGTADIQVDLGVTVLGTYRCRVSQQAGLGSHRAGARREALPAQTRGGSAGRRARSPARRSSLCTAASAARTGAGSTGNDGRSSPSWARRRCGGLSLSFHKCISAALSGIMFRCPDRKPTWPDIPTIRRRW